MLPGRSREIEKLIVCEYGVRSESSMPAVIANPPVAVVDGNVAGKLPKLAAGSNKLAGRLVRPENLGVVRAVRVPAGLVTEVDNPNPSVPESALTAMAPPMRSKTTLYPPRIAILPGPPVILFKKPVVKFGE
jgi:hypothetical protein